MKKRFICGLLALLLLLSWPGLACAAWDGSVSSSFAGGNGSQGSPYQIKTEAQLAYFASMVNAGLNISGKYFSLLADLDMSGAPWSVTADFDGSFLGNGHTITLNSSFLSSVAAGGSVDFLALQGGTEAALSAPLLCTANYGNVQNCRVSGSWVYASFRAALLCNINYGAVQNCCGIGSLQAGSSGGSSYTGFIAQNYGQIDNCYAAYTAYTTPGSGRYSTSYAHPIAGSGADLANHCYSNISGTNISQRSLAEMREEAFVEELNTYNPLSGYLWTADTADVNSGYPLLSRCLDASTHLTASADQSFTYHSSYLQTQLTCSLSGCDIYYTLDGSNPISSPTRVRYSTVSCSPLLTLYGDFLLRSVAYQDGAYGAPFAQQGIYLEGNGTAASPYLIRSKLGLKAVGLDLDAAYQLDCDLSFTAADGDWQPLGPFSGTFDGNRHTISGLSGKTGGLFYNNSGLIENLLLKEHQLYSAAGGTWGAIADYNSGRISRCYAASAFSEATLPTSSSGYLEVGGIAGHSTGVIEFCRNGGLVGAASSYRYNWQYIGGITGYGSAVSCVNEGAIVARSQALTEYIIIGGISGNGRVSNCRNNGSIYVNASMDYDVTMSCASGQGQSSRCYDGAASYLNQSASGKSYTNPPLNSYNQRTLAEGAWLLESTFANFDSSSLWMITAEGPLPQGVMDENGNCFTKITYTAPTCAQAGSELLYDSLTRVLDNQALPVIPHRPVTDAGYGATCHSNGLSEGSHCADCGAVLTEQAVISPLPHSWLPATCTAPQTCAVYQASQGQPLPVTVNEGLLQYQAFESAEDIPAGGAMLYAARYENGRVTAIDCVLVDSLSGTLDLRGGSGSQYKLFLLTPSGLTPLSPCREL